MIALLSCRRVICRSLKISGRACSTRSTSKVQGKLSTASAEPQSTDLSIDEETIKHLERISLVDFANKRGIARLEEAIKFANKLEAVDTTGVQPLVSVLENEVLNLREDEVTEENDVRVVMSSACVTEEDYYVAPPGNIPLVGRDLKELK